MPAFYRTYRPKNLSQLVGHEMTVATLKNAARYDRIAHAYLFHGSRGTGKTTTARILAKIINCEKRRMNDKFREEGEPCNECSACREIDAGRALDIVEIDAASNRGIDEIRALQEGMKLSPISLPCKVFIIDEVHMLTTPAFNALLKTLEEPPAHARFILATTEIDKVPATIISRVQVFPFRKLPAAQIAGKLTRVAESEKLKIEPAALELIAAAADGSLRDAESLLDQVAAFTGEENEITLSGAEQIIGQAGYQRLAELLKFIFTGDGEGALKAIHKLKEGGTDIVQFNKNMINWLGHLLAMTANPKMEEVLARELVREEIKTLKQLAETAALARQIELTKTLIAAHREMRYSPFAFIPFEVAVVEFMSNQKHSNIL